MGSGWLASGHVYNASRPATTHLQCGRTAHTAQLPIKAGALLQEPLRGFLATRSPLTPPSLQAALFGDPGLCAGCMREVGLKVAQRRTHVLMAQDALDRLDRRTVFAKQRGESAAQPVSRTRRRMHAIMQWAWATPYDDGSMGAHLMSETGSELIAALELL
ncbi:hypothetical protein LMG29739_04833 [Paraburkholderia solisilvae]|uniref:Uncharacterized protein n=1 Tax=Paraburkholderia solisilvae TaxID=624376 RepID=A0A6J5EIV0_9BURK|nr:hypothetical protein LMG29739_04833 [Paraburkholderia solisilvae]